MSKRFGTDRTEEEIDDIKNKMESSGYTFSLSGKSGNRSMFINDKTGQKLSMKGAASYLKLREIQE
tara:strand:- start:173 stop:370 length:198 start_codon:yes stop_codon:yes gene_type:complete